MILSARLKGMLLVLAVIIVLPAVLFFSIEPFMSWYGWRAVERNRVAMPVSYQEETSSNAVVTPSASVVPVQRPYAYTLSDAEQGIGELRDTIDRLVALALVPRDNNQRPLLTTDLVSFLVRKGRDTRTESPIITDWNTSVVLNRLQPVKLERDEYTLTVPYGASWGSPRFGVQPYELMQEGVERVTFGPITDLENEMMGVQRPGSLILMPKRTESEALVDEESWIAPEGSCGRDPRRATVNDIVRIGVFRALRLEKDYCEGGIISYEVFGETQNYLFSSTPMPNDALLRWTIERFQEK